MGEVFRSVCHSSQRTNQVERISGRIAIALLSESKDKLSLPFTAFAETGTKTQRSKCIFIFKTMFPITFSGIKKTVNSSRLFLVCENEEGDSLHRSFLGRIGVSLMLRYYKTHQWAKVNKPLLCVYHTLFIICFF